MTATPSSWSSEALASRRFARITAALALLLAAAALFALYEGRFALSAQAFFNALAAPFSDTPAHGAARVVENLIWNVRLPRIALALLAGAGLSMAGAAFQSLFNNPLASPDTLGVATGASLGAVLAMLAGAGGLAIQGAALASGLLSVAAVMAIAKTGEDSPLMLVLAGMVVAAFGTALVSLVKYAADPQDVLPQITFWLMGALSGATYASLATGMPVVLAGMFVLWLLRWRLNAAALPADEAASLGIHPARLRAIVIAAATAVTAGVVSMVGLIGWVGLLVPHAARLLLGADNRFVMPASALLGALFMLAADTLARTLTAAEIPVSVVTALIGAPVFIWLLRRTGAGRLA